MNLNLDFWFCGSGTGMPRAAGGLRAAARGCAGRRALRRSVLRLIANMTFKLFLHCLMTCELEVNFLFCSAARLRAAAQAAAQPQQHPLWLSGA